MSGYTETPLFKKLGYKAGCHAHVMGRPDHYLDLLPVLPEGVVFQAEPNGESLDLVHIFADRRDFLAKHLPIACALIKRNGMIWVSWPKKASKVPTDVTEDVVRAEAFPLGLVDVKVCAVDQVWSGLKVVIRKELR